MLTAHVGPVPPGELWSAWSTDPFVIAGLAGIAVAYALGVAAARGRPALLPVVRRRAVAGTAALVVLVVALVSPLDAAAEATFTAHMVQHVLLSAAAAPLLVLAAPVVTIRRAMPRSWRRPLDRVARTAAGPTWWRGGVAVAAATVLAAGTLTIWHAPALYDLALRSDLVHAVEHVTILGAAAAFWSAVIHAVRRSQTLVSVGALGVACAHGAALGALLALAPRPWYAHDATGWDVNALADQQLAGALMWVPTPTVYLAAAALVLHRALRVDPH